MRRSEGSAALAVVAALLAVGACGAPRSTDAREIPADEVPYALLQDSGAGADTTPSTQAAATGPQLYLIDAGDRLVPEPTAPVAVGSSGVARELLAALQSGPTEDQRARGLTTSLGPGVQLTLVGVRSGVAAVEVTLEQRDPSADRLPLVVGEIVLTLTSVPGVTAVQLLAAGEPLEAPLPGGARTTAPVTSADYAALVGPAVP